jgi:hypothetical protein
MPFYAKTWLNFSKDSTIQVIPGYGFFLDMPYAIEKAKWQVKLWAANKQC